MNTLGWIIWVAVLCWIFWRAGKDKGYSDAKKKK